MKSQALKHSNINEAFALLKQREIMGFHINKHFFHKYQHCGEKVQVDSNISRVFLFRDICQTLCLFMFGPDFYLLFVFLIESTNFLSLGPAAMFLRTSSSSGSLASYVLNNS